MNSKMELFVNRSSSLEDPEISHIYNPFIQLETFQNEGCQIIQHQEEDSWEMGGDAGKFYVYDEDQKIIYTYYYLDFGNFYYYKDKMFFKKDEIGFSNFKEFEKWFLSLYEGSNILEKEAECYIYEDYIIEKHYQYGRRERITEKIWYKGYNNQGSVYYVNDLLKNAKNQQRLIQDWIDIALQIDQNISSFIFSGWGLLEIIKNMKDEIQKHKTIRLLFNPFTSLDDYNINIDNANRWSVKACNKPINIDSLTPHQVKILDEFLKKYSNL